jgi:hypothetical protein
MTASVSPTETSSANGNPVDFLLDHWQFDRERDRFILGHALALGYAINNVVCKRNG